MYADLWAHSQIFDIGPTADIMAYIPRRDGSIYAVGLLLTVYR